MSQDFLRDLRILLKWVGDVLSRREKTPADKSIVPVLQRLNCEVGSQVEGAAGDGI